MSPLTTDKHGNITATGDGINLYRLIMLKHRLKLEVNSGLAFRQPTGPAVRKELAAHNITTPRSKTKLLEVYSAWLGEHLANLTKDPA